MNQVYDIIIVGAGPAGLAAAISAQKKSKGDILVLEKQSEIGKRIRGETLKNDAELEEKILHPEFFNEITINKTKKYRFYSPSAEKNVEIEALKERHIVGWHGLIEGLVKESEKHGIEIQSNHEVTNLLFQGEIYEGVSVFDGNKKLQVKSDLLILADGCENPLINQYGIQTPRENCPIVKVVADNVKLDGNVIELFFSSGEHIPPGVLSVFPRSETSAEANYMIFLGSMKEPFEKDIKYWWEKISTEAPIFSDRFKNSKIQYFDISFLPFGGPIKDALIPKPRIFLAGDNAGHNEATGGSGLITSMNMGYEVGQLAAEIIQSGKIDEKFSDTYKNQLIKRIRKTKTYRELRNLAQIAVDIRKAFFQILITPEKIDKEWDTVIAPSLQNAADLF